MPLVTTSGFFSVIQGGSERPGQALRSSAEQPQLRKVVNLRKFLWLFGWSLKANQSASFCRISVPQRVGSSKERPSVPARLQPPASTVLLPSFFFVLF